MQKTARKQLPQKYNNIFNYNSKFHSARHITDIVSKYRFFTTRVGRPRIRSKSRQTQDVQSPRTNPTFIGGVFSGVIPPKLSKNELRHMSTSTSPAPLRAAIDPVSGTNYRKRHNEEGMTRV